MKRSKIKKRLILWGVGTIIFAMLSAGCFVGARILTNRAYQDFITISAASAPNVRLGAYRRAIQLCPDRSEAYLLMLEVYGEDGTFSQKESDDFLTIYNANHSKLPEDNGSAAVHARAGLLYINGYEGNSTVRLRMALPFFETALPLAAEDHESYAAVACYASIGRYYRDYIWTAATKEVSEQDVDGLLENIQATLNCLINDTGGDRVFNYLGFSSAICNLFYDQRDVLAATTEKERVFSILDAIFNGLPDPQTLQVARTKEMTESILEKRTMYYDMIGRAFDRKGEG